MPGMERGNRQYTFRMAKDDFQRLAAKAAGVVHEDDKDFGVSGASEWRIGAMLRLIASGVVVVSRVPEAVPSDDD